MLKVDEFYGKSEFIDIAKGKYKIPNSIREAYKQTKRKLKSKEYK